jgi:hypothetical protein
MAKVTKPRTKKVDLKNIEAFEDLPKEEKIKKSPYNEETEKFLRKHGLL